MTAHSRPTRLLLGAGVAYATSYAVVNDGIAASLYPGYSRLSQAISELSATAAPTRHLLAAVLPVFTALMLAFGVGVWRAAEDRLALRVTGALLLAQATTFPMWLLFPMSSRAEMGAEMAANDAGHLALSAVAVALILAELGFGAAALGKAFRAYSIATAATVLGFGTWTAMMAKDVATGAPTPWLGLVERVMFGAWLLWIAVLAFTLLRERTADVREPAQAHHRPLRAMRLPS